jgi:hypothetical protein
VRYPSARGPRLHGLNLARKGYAGNPGVELKFGVIYKKETSSVLERIDWKKIGLPEANSG